jgi:hypothetical protein
VNLYESGNASFVTVPNKKMIPLWIEERREVLYSKDKKYEDKKGKEKGKRKGKRGKKSRG